MDKKLYYSIGEVSEMLGEPASVLRFWEGEFDRLKPVKNKRGVRNYTEHDIALLRRIRHLTRDCGYTLDGVREQLKRGTSADVNGQVVDNLVHLRSLLVDMRESL